MVRRRKSGGESSKNNHRVHESIAIVALILNILILPGLGTLIGGRIKEGIWQIALLVGSAIIGIFLSLTVVLMPVGIPLIFLGALAAWIWGIVSGIQLVREAER